MKPERRIYTYTVIMCYGMCMFRPARPTFIPVMSCSTVSHACLSMDPGAKELSLEINHATLLRASQRNIISATYYLNCTPTKHAAIVNTTAQDLHVYPSERQVLCVPGTIWSAHVSWRAHWAAGELHEKDPAFRGILGAPAVLPLPELQLSRHARGVQNEQTACTRMRTFTCVAIDWEGDGAGRMRRAMSSYRCSCLCSVPYFTLSYLTSSHHADATTCPSRSELIHWICSGYLFLPINSF